MSQEHIIRWARELKALELGGVPLCTLMTADPGRFPASACTCSMPKTREHFFAANPRQMHCSFGGSCKPAVLFHERVAEELHEAQLAEATPSWPKWPRGAWTAAIGRPKPT